MLYSMTGFARVEDACEQGALTWELRTVNHRYLEINFRLPEEVRALEMPLRTYLQSRLARGKVDATLRCQFADTDAAILELNKPLLQNLVQQIAWVNNTVRDFTPVNAMDVLAWPGVVRRGAQANLESLHASCFELFKTATDQLIEMRSTEGQRIEKMLQDRCLEVAVIVKKVRARHPQVLTAIKDKLQQRIEDLQAEVDQGRLEQEFVYLAQKLDIAEELDRLESHLSEMKHVFARKDATGRRLDFIMQEFHREANTMASKSADVETTQASVELKVCIEQMREQIQNIE